MRVLLIQPPISDFYDTQIRTYPLGLLYLAKKIKDIADVSILDLRTGYKPKAKKEPFFYSLNEYYKEKISPFSLFSRFYYFGMDENLIVKKLAETNPDIVCISSLFSTYFYDAIDIANIAKKINKRILVVMGGNHPTLFPEKVLQNDSVDFVIRGEGETPLYELIRALSKKEKIRDILGLCYKEGDSVFISSVNVEKDIDIVPERSLIDSSKYKIGKNKYAFMITTRGCPKKCNFCGRPELPFRKVSLKAVETDIDFCNSLGIKSIDFEDDMLTLDTKHFLNTLNILSSYNFDLSAMNGIYIETLNKEILTQMLKAGFKRLNISLVDISEKVLKIQNRFKPNFVEFIPLIEKFDFLTEIHFIIGLPYQKAENVLNNLIFLMEHKCLPAPSMFYLAPGSKIYENFPERNEIDLKALRSSYIIEMPESLSRKQIYSLVLISRFISFVKRIIDKNNNLNRLSEIIEVVDKNYQDLLKILFEEKSFFYIDKQTGILVEEPIEKDLIELFFKKAKNRIIKGFKSHNKIIFDV